MKIIRQFSETNFTQTTKSIFFKFGTYSRVYGGHKICRFDRKSVQLLEIQQVENGNLVVHVKNLCATQLSWPLTYNHVS